MTGQPGTGRSSGQLPSGAKLAGAAALIAILTVLARLAGFGRTMVFFHTVGNGAADGGLASLYLAANTIPNIVFELVAGGALASLVVPLLAGAVAVGDRERAGRVTSALLTWVLALTIPLALVVWFAAGPITGLFQGVPPEYQEIAARMLRIFAPQLPLYGIGIVLTGVLQAHHRFAWPVIAPLLSSATVMAAYLTYAGIDGAQSGFAGLSRAGELTLSVGTTLGVVALSLCLVIPVARLRLRIRPSFRFPGDEGRQAVRLGWAGAVTVGAQQVVVALITVLALLQMAPYTGAQTLFLLPWAVLAVPLATAVYPRLSAAAANGDEDGYATALSGTARSVVLLAGLGTAGLAGLAVPMTSPSLMNVPNAVPGVLGLAPGLLGYALFALLSRALYARGATVAAAVASAVGWLTAGLGVIVTTLVADGDGEVFGLGLATATGMSVTGVLLVLAVRRNAGAAALAGLGRAVVAAVVAAVFGGLAGWGTVAWMGSAVWPTPGVLGSLVEGMLGGVAVVAVFGAVAFALDRRDLGPLAATVTRRLRR
ncbi:putative peptidoglycan lipid II flippase [Actinoplanes derwentensis]|uniref:Putative peptidoglycan lipid II flippase n=1 Tax=Actinoplanes derwentensis TaxID=113562 RepID=A0A1H2DBF7_9ACTN|nr:membrane protein [Actinoplanes derwentensis]SDT79929.1 putative peptidoglycan lipid II flippase [Actinoplanes derwentensis]